MSSVSKAKETLGIAPACEALGVPRASFYRAQQPPFIGPLLRRKSPRKLTPAQQDQALALLHSERFVDSAPEEVVATLLDEQVYVCSPRTMYRLLEAHQELRERRNQLKRPTCVKPELLATKPNELWCWDISKLLGPAKWTYYYLYVVLDVYSRYIVGWTVAERESGALARQLFEETAARQGVKPGQLTAHADNGSPMISLTLTQLFGLLGITKTHSRPYTSNDNPFIEALFKTTKFTPGYPERFMSLAEAVAWMREFVRWYNEEHRHGGIGMYTPHDVHFGKVAEKERQRAAVLAAAYQATPERFVKGPPKPTPVPTAVWINPPKPLPATTAPLLGAAETGNGTGV